MMYKESLAAKIRQHYVIYLV